MFAGEVGKWYYGKHTATQVSVTASPCHSKYRAPNKSSLSPGEVHENITYCKFVINKQNNYDHAVNMFISAAKLRAGFNDTGAYKANLHIYLSFLLL